MKRRTLDIMISTAALGLAAILAVLGFVLMGNATFAEDYVQDQLAQQKIKFKAADKLTPEEKAFTNARTGCVIANAGKPLQTGKQAECYANEYIGAHLANPAGFSKGKTYAELGDVQTDLRAKIASAEAVGDPGVATLKKELTDVTTARETVFKGEMLRGALLTSYGFSDLGTKAAQGARVAWLAAIVLGLVAFAGYVHAFVTPKTKAFAPVEIPIAEQINGKKEHARI